MWLVMRFIACWLGLCPIHANLVSRVISCYLTGEGLECCYFVCLCYSGMWFLFINCEFVYFALSSRDGYVLSY